MKAKKIVVFVVGLLLLMVFLSLMFTYQVRSNEIVLVQAWSGSPEIKYGSTNFMTPKALKEKQFKDDAGIQFRLPWPLQKVRELDGRVHVMETGFDEELGAGGASVKIAVYAGWHVNDAEKFRNTFARFRSAEAMMRQAQEYLSELVRGARSELMGTKKLMDFLGKDGEGSLGYVRIEEEIREKVVPKAAEVGLGIKFLGIKRIGLPDSLAQSVLKGMTEYKQEQINLLNQETLSKANKIEKIAQTEGRAIIRQAENNATNLRNKAQSEVTDSYRAADSSERRAKLAITLKQIKALEVLRDKPIQLIISDNHPLFNVLDEVTGKPAPQK
ncbi:MAG: SPFH domain-containing protein [Verrucomicrobiota bacterium]|jgi:regulator of protease activity HflC (stomatin/prohibitin superfamily)|nr:SPFH domain-containing protein [Verrucomicrobiota bacterium]